MVSIWVGVLSKVFFGGLYVVDIEKISNHPVLFGDRFETSKWIFVFFLRVNFQMD